VIARLALVVGFLGMGGVALDGCGASSAQIGSSIVAGGLDAMTCAPDDYQAFAAAARDGGAGGINWIAAVIDTIQCAAQVYHDVASKLSVARLQQMQAACESEEAWAAFEWGRRQYLAGDAPADGIERWSRRGIKRLVRAVKIAQAMGYAKGVQ